MCGSSYVMAALVGAGMSTHVLHPGLISLSFFAAALALSIWRDQVKINAKQLGSNTVTSEKADKVADTDPDEEAVTDTAEVADTDPADEEADETAHETVD